MINILEISLHILSTLFIFFVIMNQTQSLLLFQLYFLYSTSYFLIMSKLKLSLFSHLWQLKQSFVTQMMEFFITQGFS
jgi:hypothetical protein